MRYLDCSSGCDVIFLLAYLFSLYNMNLIIIIFKIISFPELLRVMRRLNLKEQWTDISLHYITLGTLRSVLSENTRAQNHFRSIGGLEVLLDGLGLPSSKFSISKHSLFSGDERWTSDF